MKVLILGATGMLGHKLWQVLRDGFDTYVTMRQSFNAWSRYELFERERTFDGVFAEQFDGVKETIETVQPNVVINCLGVVKQHPLAKDPVTTITVNALFPHQVACACRSRQIRMIHISTDCVFSGRNGNYDEDDVPDAEDLYGRTKLMGEVVGQGCLTLRTSMVGRELAHSYGLIEWFLRQGGQSIRGYKRAVFSGVTTRTLAEIVARLIEEHPDLEGIWHVASDPISKFELLSIVKRAFRVDVDILPDKEVQINRSLNGQRFRRATGLTAPSWPDMIAEMYRDLTPYAAIRRAHADR